MPLVDTIAFLRRPDMEKWALTARVDDRRAPAGRKGACDAKKLGPWLSDKAEKAIRRFKEIRARRHVPGASSSQAR